MNCRQRLERVSGGSSFICVLFVRKVVHPLWPVLNGHLQDVRYPSRIERFRELETDLSAFLMTQDSQVVITACEQFYDMILW